MAEFGNEAGHSIDRRGTLRLMLGGCAVSLLADGAAIAAAHKMSFDDGLPRALPEQQNIESAALIAFLKEVEARGFDLNSFMLARNGAVVAEGYWAPYRAELSHMTHSLTKSVTASGVGLAIGEGRFAPHDRVISFFESELPPAISDNLALMTVEDLLTMRTGHAVNVSGSVWRPIKTSWVAEFFKIPVVHRPGTTFVYTSAATFMLSAIISRTTGQSTFDYMKPRFFEPLGIRGAQWDAGPQNITPGANGLSWTVADSLKLGLVHQQDGMFAGRRVLPAEWARAVHQPHVPGEYGYQWWLGDHGRYSAIGMFGQYCYVYPEQGVVFAVMSALGTRRDEWEAVLKRHMPAMFGGGPVRPDQRQARILSRRLSALAVDAPLGRRTSRAAAALSGRTFIMDANEDGVEWIRVDFTGDRCLFVLKDARGEHRVECGLGAWIEGQTSLTGNRLHHEYQPDRMRIVAGAGWIDGDVLEMIWQFTETAFRDRATCRVIDGALHYDRSVNVNSGLLKLPTLKGRTAEPA